METIVVGIDVSKDKLDVCLRDLDRQKSSQFVNTSEGHQQLVNWMGKPKIKTVHVCLEATGQYGDRVAEHLYQQGYTVCVVNPARIKAYGCSKLRRNKTDKADAELIADFCASQNPVAWTPPPSEFKDLQALVRRLDDLIEARQQESNRLQSGITTDAVVTDLKEHMAYLATQIEKIRQLIQNHIDQHPDLRKQQELLQSIPGIAKLTAARLLSEIRTIQDFDSARQLAAYAGLTPENFISGSSVHKKSRLSKTGNANLRKALYMPAIVAKQWNPIIRSFCARLALAGLRPMEVIGAAMRKLLHLVYGVLKHGKPFDPDYLVKVQAAS